MADELRPFKLTEELPDTVVTAIVAVLVADLVELCVNAGTMKAGEPLVISKEHLLRTISKRLMVEPRGDDGFALRVVARDA